jgi:hypothetical protein
VNWGLRPVGTGNNLVESVAGSQASYSKTSTVAIRLFSSVHHTAVRPACSRERRRRVTRTQRSDRSVPPTNSRWIECVWLCQLMTSGRRDGQRLLADQERGPLTGPRLWACKARPILSYASALFFFFVLLLSLIEPAITSPLPISRAIPLCY